MKTYKYKNGFVFGKFFPAHKGHLHLINTSLENSENVILLVCSLKREPIPGELRFFWLKEIYKNEPRLTVKYCNEELPQYPEEHKDFWKIWVDVANRYAPGIDCLFTSELYGEPYSEHLGIDHYLVDLERKTYPISATKVRNNPFENWEFIPDNIKPFFCKKVALVGPESVGKTVLSQKLAKHYNTNYVHEYGRTLYEEKNGNLLVEDFLKISKVRQNLEDEALKNTNKLLICDTEDFITFFWLKLYFPNDWKKFENYFEEKISKSKYDLFILLKPDCDAIQDGTRLYLPEREDHYKIIKNELKKRNFNFVEIGGSWEERFNDSIEIIDNLFFNI